MKVPRWTPADPAAITARKSWAKAMAAHITDPTSPAGGKARPPIYGSPCWAALADDDPRKLAAAVIAAECWATDLDELPDRLRRELDTLHAAYTDAAELRWTEAFEEARQIARSSATPAAFALRAHYAKTQAERITEARRPRPGDYPGHRDHLHRNHPNTGHQYTDHQHTDAVQDGEAA
ncbi:DUF2742 domain-containing protein [Kribbella solani]|uniref:DUF2742 domain-containing protein n=1 Tax=Kribbella solani TaxID=236067 RepID=UPI0029A21ACA|nr:DUF2742 domain-containing protein [Kribbella solani]MDX2969853.1 DUF2742 domain-containing protein [Kribbella solani]